VGYYSYETNDIHLHTTHTRLKNDNFKGMFKSGAPSLHRDKLECELDHFDIFTAT